MIQRLELFGDFGDEDILYISVVFVSQQIAITLRNPRMASTVSCGFGEAKAPAFGEVQVPHINFRL